MPKRMKMQPTIYRFSKSENSLGEWIGLFVATNARFLSSGSLAVLPRGSKTASPRQLNEVFDGGEISLFWLEFFALNAKSVLFSPGK
jgi:hypothetical protein